MPPTSPGCNWDSAGLWRERGVSSQKIRAELFKPQKVRGDWREHPCVFPVHVRNAELEEGAIPRVPWRFMNKVLAFLFQSF